MQERKGTYIDGYVYAEPVMFRPRPCVLVVFVEVVMAHDQRVLGQLLVEALGLRTVDEKVQRLSGGAQRQEGEYRPHLLSLLL